MGVETLVITTIATAAITLSLMFLPAAIELKHPKDAGPRLISDDLALINILPIVNIEFEEEHPNDRAFIVPTAGFLKTIPSLEL